MKKYQRIHDEIVQRGKSRTIVGYSENHHILPECMGGTESSENMVRLTAREHFIMHHLLTKIYPRNHELKYAFNMMLSTSKNQERYVPSSIFYEIARKQFSEFHPCKDTEVKSKISSSLKQYYLTLGKFTEFTYCKECNECTYSRNMYCSSDCRFAEKRRIKESKMNSCVICGNKHSKKYACSKKCFNEYVKMPDNQYSKDLSDKRKKILSELSKEEMKDYLDKSMRTGDEVARGLAISKGKLNKNKGI